MNNSKKKATVANDAYNRRKMLARTGTLLGATLLPAAFNRVNAQQENGTDSGFIFNVRSYGASGEKNQNATALFRKAIEDCFHAGGGIVYVPPGEYTVGMLQLFDNVNLHIEAGATLFLSQSRDDFKKGARAMIYAENASNIAVTGNGTLDGLAQYDYREMKGVDPEISKEIEIARAAGQDMRRYYRKASAMNTFMFVINDCTGFQLKDVRIIHSPLWNVKLSDCNRITISGVYIYSDLEKGVNADGIDICSCSNVMISDSIISTGDDAIIIKTIPRNGKPANPSQNITVTNCILESSSKAFGIGTETHADISNVVLNNSVIRNSNTGFGINIQDGANVSDIIFSNLTIELNRRHWNWWGSAETCKIVLKKRNADSRLGTIKNVFISNIISHPRGTSTIVGHPEQPLENITIDNLQLLMNPEDKPDKRATDAFQIESVKQLNIKNLTVRWNEKETEKKWGSALVLNNVSGVLIDSFTGRQGLVPGESPAVVLNNVSDATIRDCDAAVDTGTFLRLDGDSHEIVIRNNNFLKAKQGVAFEDESVKSKVRMDLNL
jgi:polygalacturonase